MISVSYKGLTPYPGLLRLRKPQIDSLLQKELNEEAKEVKFKMHGLMQVTGLARAILDRNIVIDYAKSSELQAAIIPTTERILIKEFAYRYQVIRPSQPTRARILAITGLHGRYVTAGGFINPLGGQQAPLRTARGGTVKDAIGPSLQPMFATLASDEKFISEAAENLLSRINSTLREFIT